MNLLKLTLAITLLMAALTEVTAQVTGIVTDAKGEPIIAANVVWMNMAGGTTTNEEGHFSITKPQGANHLVVSYIGYVNDTIRIKSANEHLDIALLEDATQLDEVVVKYHQVGKSRNSLLNTEQITAEQLTRAACCNLGESFTSNASVDVNYADAASGAKQIKLLGLAGTYVQMLTENIPNYRGAAIPFALGYIPGPWMQSIQVSKGTSSVKNGYESITGQINVEFKKPQGNESVSANLYVNSKTKVEANFDGNAYLGKRWKVGILGHYEDYNKDDDMNNDGFQDMPKIRQYNLQNRWAWMGDNYVFQASLKALNEQRHSGQSDKTMHHSGLTLDAINGLYQIGINTQRYEAFTKNAYIIDKEKNTNVALILSGSWHDVESFYGRKGYNQYDVKQGNLYAQLMFETELGTQHSLSVGVSGNYDHYDQTALAGTHAIAHVENIEKEFTPGAYAQYTYNLNDQLVLMGGLRIDHSSVYGTFVTPRAHVRWAPSELFSLRGTIGKGYRTNHIMAENSFYLGSSRQMLVDANLKQESAWNYGASTVFDIPITEERKLNLSAEYYYTRFGNQTVIDLDTDAHAVHFTNLQGQSFSHTMQVEATFPILEGLELSAAYRLTDVKQTINGVLRNRPLTIKNKGVLSASYKTPLQKWQFDATLQLNGSGRMPDPDTNNPLWDSSYPGFQQLSAQITRWFRHWSVYIGGENLTGFRQKQPFIAADNPWGKNFDSTMCWGPVEGAMFYIGFRLNFVKF